MDIAIVYFSQTGNTQKIASEITDTLSASGHFVRMLPLMNLKVEDISKVDMLGVGTPCFSSKTPQPVIHFIRSLKHLHIKQAFIFATNGGAPGSVLSDMSTAFNGIGIQVIGGLLTRGEVHHPAPSLNGRFSNRPGVQDLDKARAFAAAIYSLVSSKNSKQVLRNYTSYLQRRWSFYEILGSATFDVYLRMFLPKPKLKKEQCNQCGSCLDECPARNIQLNPYPVMRNHCIRCYHCFACCPQEAYSIDWKFADRILGFLYHPKMIKLFSDLEQGEQIY